MTGASSETSVDAGEEGGGHPTTTLNDVVHQRVRLGILTVLQETQRADFGYLKSALELTDGNLGRHIEILEKQGLVATTKGYQGRRPRTWVEITADGRRALAVEMKALKRLLTRFENSEESAGSD
ncbi:winged helix-turn-helix domain-containing protein [Actinomadura terrae]|uniref:winged helix-turn-helix domain-containing protein n=1 Tax=Actinomadura terrae TaxID=604353 RepID=UPI001FA7DB4C|nr:transcriptional regulator [Actinomadura terrae]